MTLLSDKYLHPLVYVIADKPGKKNLHPAIPLVGTSSYKTLLNWLGQMNIDISRVRLFNQSSNPFGPLAVNSLNVAVKNKHIKILALGKVATKYLADIGIAEFFSLPHPSGLNRVLNSKKQLKKILDQCETYVYI